MRFTGKVKWFNESKGYGFIQRDEGPDLFVHYTNIMGKGFRTLKENDDVEFEVNEGPKGLQAVNVSKV
ncbi:MAG: cold shock domain-containing protein [Thermodesulfobacteriota bacterium]